MHETTYRNTDLGTLVRALRQRADIKEDMVLSSDRLAMKAGELVVRGHAQMTTEGVSPDATYRPTAHCGGTIAAQLNIPTKYYRRMEAEHVELLDANVNGWLQRAERILTLRTFRGWTEELDDGALRSHSPVARMLASDRYKRIDDEDVVTSIIAGMTEAGLGPENIDGCDLSDTNMRIRVKCPEVEATAPTLLRNYRSPFAGSGHGGDAAESPYAVWAGFVASNSEVGNGAFSIAPRLVVKVCDNGMVVNEDVMRAIHLGGRQQEGVIRVGDDTQKTELELIRLRARDAVATFLDRTYVEEVIERLEAKLCGDPLSRPQDVLEVLQRKQGWSSEELDGILSDFIAGGDARPSGILQAITSYAQRVEDPDRAADLEASALGAAMSAA